MVAPEGPVIAIIIPALNEAESIRALLVECLESLPAINALTGIPSACQIIVVDNGSTDGTGEVAASAGAAVVRENRRGYGAACAAGAAVTTAELLVFMDGDGSFVPAEAVALLSPILAGEADLVLGTRLRGGLTPGSMPPHQLFGNRLVARLVRVLYGIPLTDLGPFRAVRRNLLLSLQMEEMTYGWPIEMIVKAARRGARIIEAPVSYRPRFAGESKVSGTLRGTVLAAQRILATTFRHARGALPGERIS